MNLKPTYRAILASAAAALRAACTSGPQITEPARLTAALDALGGGPVTGALAQGFAVISADAGHTGRQHPRFGAEAQARADCGYQAVATLTPMAKALLSAACGKAPERSYIGGCSKGRRHALVAAARHGAQFDGYWVGAPGYRLPYAALAQLWAAPQWQALATPGATLAHPFNAAARTADLNTALTAAERLTVARAMLERCDALDGARDGIVAHTAACQAAFNAERDVATCGAERNGQCLSAAQQRLNRAQGGKAADFARYFPVPGMAHCTGGPATDQFDALAPLVRWVEQGEAPANLAARARARGAGAAGGANAELPADWAPSRSRAQCPWPQVSRNNGSGSLDDAASFSCAQRLRVFRACPRGASKRAQSRRKAQP